jgi:hypothetical protein
VEIAAERKCPRLFLARIPKPGCKQVIPMRDAKSGMLDLG